MYYVYNSNLLRQVLREQYNNCLWRYVGYKYRESNAFIKVCSEFIHNICINNPTNKVGPIIHQFLKMTFNEPDFRNGVYKDIQYKILPVLWKNHKAIERKKQKKLNFLANKFDRNGRFVEAQVIRTIVESLSKRRFCQHGRQPKVSCVVIDGVSRSCLKSTTPVRELSRS